LRRAERSDDEVVDDGEDEDPGEAEVVEMGCLESERAVCRVETGMLDVRFRDCKFVYSMERNSVFERKTA